MKRAAEVGLKQFRLMCRSEMINVTSVGHSIEASGDDMRLKRVERFGLSNSDNGEGSGTGTRWRGRTRGDDGRKRGGGFWRGRRLYCHHVYVRHPHDHSRGGPRPSQ